MIHTKDLNQVQEALQTGKNVRVSIEDEPTPPRVLAVSVEESTITVLRMPRGKRTEQILTVQSSMFYTIYDPL